MDIHHILYVTKQIFHKLKTIHSNEKGLCQAKIKR